MTTVLSSGPSSSLRSAATGTTLALLALAAGAAWAQTPGLPAAAEATAPASKIGPPVPKAPAVAPTISNTPARSTPSRSTTLTLPRTPADPSGDTLPPLTPASAPRA